MKSRLSKTILIFLTIVLVFLFSAPSLISADTLSVPGDYSTIQAAIDAAKDGDTISIAPGTYYENLSILMSHYTYYLVGSSPSNTIIDGGDNDRVVFAYNPDGPSSDDVLILKNLKITNGDTNGSGGGILSQIYRLDLDNCIVSNNHATSGGAIFTNQILNISNCTISNNLAGSGYLGGGIYGSGTTCNITITNSKIHNNTAGETTNTIGAEGGGIRLSGGSLTINNSSIIGNVSYPFGTLTDDGIYISSTLNATNNWWGSSSGPYHSSLNTSGTGNSIIGNVSYDDFYPWLLSDPFSSGTNPTSLEVEIPPVYVPIRTAPFTCWQVYINEDNNFEFIFWWLYGSNNWVKIYDMDDNLVFEKDLEYGKPVLEVDLPDGFYTVRTYHTSDEAIQEFLIGKP